MLTCPWTPEPAYDIARALFGRSLLRGQASTACLDHFGGEQRASARWPAGLLLLEPPGHATLLEPIETDGDGMVASQNALGQTDEGSHVSRRVKAAVDVRSAVYSRSTF